MPLHPSPAASGGPPAASRGEELTLADPERALAVAYALPAIRPALTALFALDERLGGIVGSTTEPMIGLMRLAWWREALERLDASAPAEPLLQALAAKVLPRGVPGADLAGIEDGWAALLDGEPDAEAISRHGRERGGRLFACAAHLLRHPGPVPGSIVRLDDEADGEDQFPGSSRTEGWTPEQVRGDGVRQAGEGWALADLAHRHSSPEVRTEARAQARAALAEAPRCWPRALRPLGMLAALAARDAASDAARRQGSPGRLLRMLALRLTGR